MSTAYLPIGNAAVREGRVRRELAKRGLALRRDRARSWSLDHLGGYRIVEPYANFIVAGSRFELSLEAVEAWAFDDD